MNKKTLKPINNINCITVSISGVQELLGIGKSKAYEVGELAGAKLKIGTRTVYRVDKLKEYIDKLTEEQQAQ